MLKPLLRRRRSYDPFIFRVEKDIDGDRSSRL
jgi:hypothetical protein